MQSTITPSPDFVINPFRIRARASYPDVPNMILNGRNTDYHCPAYVGALSIKLMFNGQAVYEVEGSRFAVDESSYLLLNHGQRYAMQIESEQVVESFCVFFRPGFAEAALRSLVTPADKLLDAPQDDSGQAVQFFDRLYPRSESLMPILQEMRAAVQRGDAQWSDFEEAFHLLLERLLHVHRGVYREVERLPAVRAATRVELYRRLHRARDFMDSSLEQPLTLAQIAAVAWFSPHHFLRLFKQVFHETPHQYLTRRRLERAQKLLTQTEQPITDICFAVGLEHPGSFSRLFRQRLGLSPERFRLQSQNRPAK